MRAHTVIFSSSSSLHIAKGLHSNLKKEQVIHLWKGDFFGKNKTTPLWTFFKKLFNYDYAILILSDDNIILDKQSDKSIWVPRDNVIFELGATMARLGPQKTILLLPDYLDIHLPGYFDQEVKPIKFFYQKPVSETIEATKAATKAAAKGIQELLTKVEASGFHSELAAQGLAHAYLQNFLNVALRLDIAQTFEINKQVLPWKKENGIKISIIIPDEIMDVSQVNAFFKSLNNCYNLNIKTFGGRNLSVYVLARNQEDEPLHILDIPTILFTAGEIVENIEAFWRDKDKNKVIRKDKKFSTTLKQREILNFTRSLQSILAKRKTSTYFVPITDIDKHLEQMSF